MWSRTRLPLPCLIIQLHRTFIFDAKLDAYALSLVNIVIEHILVTYRTIIREDWNRNTIEENMYTTDLTQEEDDTFFAHDLPADSSD